MIRDTLLMMDPDQDIKTMNHFKDHMCHECGGMKTHFSTRNPRMMFVSYDDAKTSIHDIPLMAKKQGLNIHIVDF